MIKAILFDLGNVIIPFDHRRIFQKLDLPAGLSAEEALEKVFRLESQNGYHIGNETTESFLQEINDTLSQNFSIEEFSEAWVSSLGSEPLISEALIKRLAKSYRMLILSDTNVLHFEFVKREFPIMSHFEDFVLSYQVGFMKPSEEIFAAAVKKAGCRPHECCFIDDLRANVEAATQYGLKAIEYSSPEQLTMSLKDFRVI